MFGGVGLLFCFYFTVLLGMGTIQDGEEKEQSGIQSTEE